MKINQNNSQNIIGLQLVHIIEREQMFLRRQKELSEKYESAENMKNLPEMERIGLEAEKLNHEVSGFVLMKITVMTAAQRNCPEYYLN